MIQESGGLLHPPLAVGTIEDVGGIANETPF